MTTEQREEAGYRYLAALRMLADVETGYRSGPPPLVVACILSLVWHGLEWERGLRP